MADPANTGNDGSNPGTPLMGGLRVDHGGIANLGTCACLDQGRGGPFTYGANHTINSPRSIRPRSPSA